MDAKSEAMWAECVDAKQAELAAVLELIGCKPGAHDLLDALFSAGFGKGWILGMKHMAQMMGGESMRGQLEALEDTCRAVVSAGLEGQDAISAAFAIASGKPVKA